MDALDDSFFERLINIQSYGDTELTELIHQLEGQEAELSKRRRLLQGEIDILKAERERRLRDRQDAGQSLVNDGSVDALSHILSRRAPRNESTGEKSSVVSDGMEQAVRGIQKRFRDVSVDVREERVVRYIVKQVRLGRHFDDILADARVADHTSDVARARMLENPAVLRAIEQEIRQQFADYSSVTGPGAEDDGSD